VSQDQGLGLECTGLAKDTSSCVFNALVFTSRGQGQGLGLECTIQDTDYVESCV
jgi:hypothetical protein